MELFGSAVFGSYSQGADKRVVFVERGQACAANRAVLHQLVFLSGRKPIQQIVLALVLRNMCTDQLVLHLQLIGSLLSCVKIQSPYGTTFTPFQKAT